jgi:alpha-mannosidase
LTHVLSGSTPYVETFAEVDWREIGSPKNGIPGLIINFDSNDLEFAEPMMSYVCETPFGTVLRQYHDESDVPTNRFTFQQGNRSFLTVFQDSKYGTVLGSAVMQMRVLRSSFDPDHAPEVAKSSFRYGVHFHTEPPTNAELVRLKTAFNHPLIVFPANLQEGNGGLSRSFVKTVTPNVVLTALKRAEDGDGLVLRVVEYDGVDTEVRIELHPDLLHGRTKAENVDLMERPTGEPAQVEGSTVIVKVKAKSFATVKIR